MGKISQKVIVIRKVANGFAVGEARPNILEKVSTFDPATAEPRFNEWIFFKNSDEFEKMRGQLIANYELPYFDANENKEVRIKLTIERL